MKHENVYTAEEENSHSFYLLPKELFLNERYKHLSVRAKVAYAFLLDMKKLSKENKWIDEQGQPFVVCTRERVRELLNSSNSTASKVFKELRTVKLILEEKLGASEPTRIYVLATESEDD